MYVRKLDLFTENGPLDIRKNQKHDKPQKTQSAKLMSARKKAKYQTTRQIMKEKEVQEADD